MKKKVLIMICLIILTVLSFLIFTVSYFFPKKPKGVCYPFPDRIDEFNCSGLESVVITEKNKTSFFCVAGEKVFIPKKYWKVIYFADNTSLIFQFGIPEDKEKAKNCFEHINVTPPEYVSYKETDLDGYKGYFVQSVIEEAWGKIFIKYLSFLDENTNYFMILNKGINSSENFLSEEEMKSLALEFKDYAKGLIK